LPGRQQAFGIKIESQVRLAGRGIGTVASIAAVRQDGLDVKVVINFHGEFLTTGDRNLPTEQRK
jgi:ABC-type transporter Mla subunit MlaD